jgi:hypothetical protein
LDCAAFTLDCGAFTPLWFFNSKRRFRHANQKNQSGVKAPHSKDCFTLRFIPFKMFLALHLAVWPKKSSKIRIAQ